MTRSFVVRVSEICCWALGFVGARVRWEDVRLVVTSFIACWGARCCLQAHIRYRVKFVARVLECLLFASSCQLCCQVCSSFGSPATPRGKVVGTILRQRSCCGSLKSSNLRQRSCCGSLKSSNFSLAFYNIAEGGGGAPSKSHGFLYDKIAHFGGTSFSAAKSLKNGAVPHVTSPVAMGMVSGTWRTCFEKAGWLSKPRSSSQFCAKGGPKIGSAPVLVPRHLRGTKTGAVWWAQFWARLLRKFAS